MDCSNVSCLEMHFVRTPSTFLLLLYRVYQVQRSSQWWVLKWGMGWEGLQEVGRRQQVRSLSTQRKKKHSEQQNLQCYHHVTWTESENHTENTCNVIKTNSESKYSWLHSFKWFHVTNITFWQSKLIKHCILCILILWILHGVDCVPRKKKCPFLFYYLLWDHVEWNIILPGCCHGDTNILRMHFTPNMSIWSAATIECKDLFDWSRLICKTKQYKRW